MDDDMSPSPFLCCRCLLGGLVHVCLGGWEGGDTLGLGVVEEALGNYGVNDDFSSSWIVMRLFLVLSMAIGHGLD